MIKATPLLAAPSRTPFQSVSAGSREEQCKAKMPIDRVEIKCEETAKPSPLDGYLKEILKHATAQVSSELLNLPAAQLMFHGTSVEFDAVEARPNTRVGSGGKIDWQGEAIFAAMDPRVALHYTASRGKGIGAGIDLRSYTSPSEPIAYGLRGGSSKEDALDKAYGKAGQSGGFIHLLDKSKFVTESGLGKMEMITRDESANLGRVDLDARSAIDALIATGDVIIQWSSDR